MGLPLSPQEVRPIGIDGLVRQAEVDDILIPDGAVTEVLNMHFDRKGAATVRAGLTTLGGTVVAGYGIVGLHNAQQGTMITVVDVAGSTSIYRLSGGSWGVTLSGGTASVRARFVDFGSVSVALNFSANTLSSMRFWTLQGDGASYWKSTGNPINPQNMWGYNPQYGEVYKSRIYLAGDNQNPSRLFFSSVVSATGNITWTPDVDYVDINPGDGENITALKRFSTELLTFKPNYLYRYRTTGTDPDALIKVGTRSQESVVEGKLGVYFHNDKGFFRYSGAYPDEIGRPISDIVAAIPFTKYGKISGWSDSDHIYWSIGTITVSEAYANVTYKNVIVRYTESSQVWTMYSYPHDVTRGTTFSSATTQTQVIGTEFGVVATQDSGVTDYGEPISYRIVTKWLEWGGIANQKVIETLLTLCEKAQGANFMCQVDDNPVWHDIGTLTKFLNIYRRQKIVFHRIRFKVTGVSRIEPMVLRAIGLIEGINEGLVQP